jgi:Putative zinc-finger
MACPDELTLDLWLAGALPADEASSIEAHVGTCSTCTASKLAWRASATDLHAALSLDADEHAFLATLDLPATWRARSASVPWSWLALFSVVAAFAAWTLAGPFIANLVGVAAQAGAGTYLITTALSLLFSFGQAVLSIANSPALSLTQPLLAVLALALLLWPRARTTTRGVVS